jgi:hypothetical protein
MIMGAFSLDSIILSAGHGKHVQEAGAQALPFGVRDRFNEKKIACDANNIKVNEDLVYPKKHCGFCTFVDYTQARGVSQALPMKMMQALTLQVQRSALLDDERRRKWKDQIQNSWKKKP